MIVIDCSQFSNKEAAHAYIAKMLGFPEYYGGNLDALYDCLNELKSNTSIGIRNSALAGKYLGEYGTKLLQVFDAASCANPNLSLFYYFDI